MFREMSGLFANFGVFFRNAFSFAKGNFISFRFAIFEFRTALIARFNKNRPPYFWLPISNIIIPWKSAMLNREEILRLDRRNKISFLVYLSMVKETRGSDELWKRQTMVS